MNILILTELFWAVTAVFIKSPVEIFFNIYKMIQKFISKLRKILKWKWNGYWGRKENTVY